MDNYTIIEQLGEGSFGQVFKAKLNENHKRVLIASGALNKQYSNKLTYAALKIISIKSRSFAEVKTLWNECEIQRSLKHPNIIEMFEAFRTDNEIVVITEFAHKQLCVILEEKKFLPEDKVQKITCDLVSALYYLHSNNIIHRDLKPQNVLLDKNDRAKLCDFGFAKIISNDMELLTSIKGTPLYMAPELFERKPYDFTVDLWSLGCIIYQLLIGISPFHTNCYFQLINLIKTKDVKWPKCISIFCDSFLKGLLQKEPSNRFDWEQILTHPFVCENIYIQKPESNSEQHSSDIESEDDSTDKLHSSCSSICTPESRCSPSHYSKSDIDKEGIIDCRVDESIGFLLNSMKEIMDNDFQSLTNSIYTKVLLLPLKNYGTNYKVLDYSVYILTLPFSMKNVPAKILTDVENVYMELNVFDILLKIISSIIKTSNYIGETYLRIFNNIFQLMLNRISKNDILIDSFCYSIIYNNTIAIFHDILHEHRNSLAAKTILGILIEIMQKKRNYKTIVESVIWFNESTSRILLLSYLRHNNPILKMRICYLICLLIENGCEYLRNYKQFIYKDLMRVINDALKPDFVRNISRITLAKLEALTV